MTDDQIITIARRKGSFSVSLRWRDDRLRARCFRLRKEGHLSGGRRIIHGSFVFTPRTTGDQHGQDPQPLA